MYRVTMSILLFSGFLDDIYVHLVGGAMLAILIYYFVKLKVKLIDLADRVNGIVTEWFGSKYDLTGYKFGYYYVLNNWQQTILILQRRDLQIINNYEKFQLNATLFPAKIINLKMVTDDQRCRMINFKVFKNRHQLKLTFQPTSYFDYLRSNEHINHLSHLGNPKETYQKVFFTMCKKGDMYAFPLTNICGSGIFLLTKDHKVVFSQHSAYSRVYPGRSTFTVSGVLEWRFHSNQISPFQDIAEKCAAKIGYHIKEENIKMIGFGADERKLYFQFSFIEESQLTWKQIEQQYNERNHDLPEDKKRKLRAEDFNLENIIKLLFSYNWEPSAEAALLVLCAKKFNHKKVEKMLFSFKQFFWQKRMEDEWDYRASLPGEYADLSERYPIDEIKELSTNYIVAIVDFIGVEMLNGKKILEIGCGTGRVTLEILKNKPADICCVEFCELMRKKHYERTHNFFKDPPVRYKSRFFQDWEVNEQFDLAICSLVLIHNNDEDLEKIVAKLCLHSKKIYVFEDISNRGTSDFTFIRTKETIINLFKINKFKNSKKTHFDLSVDKIIFLEFVREE